MNFLKYKSNTKNCLEILPERKDSGFTLVETLIAITLISLIGIPVFMAFSDTIGYSKKIKDLNRWNKELIHLENVLRKSAGEVQIPFLISDIKLNEESGGISVPYCNGDASSVLEIRVEDNALKITNPRGSTIFKGYNEVKVNLLKDEGLRTIGLTIKVKKTKREDVEFQCVFGAIGRAVFSEK